MYTSVHTYLQTQAQTSVKSSHSFSSFIIKSQDDRPTSGSTAQCSTAQHTGMIFSILKEALALWIPEHSKRRTGTPAHGCCFQHMAVQCLWDTNHTVLVLTGRQQSSQTLCKSLLTPSARDLVVCVAKSCLLSPAWNILFPFSMERYPQACVG